MTRARRILLPALVALGFAGLGAWFGLARLGPDPADADALARLFAQRLADAGGREFALAPLRGRLVVVNFWATWCPPCVEEMPELDELQREFGARGLQIVGIGIDSATNIARFAAKTPMQYPLLVGAGDSMALLAALGNTRGGLPFTVVVAPDGRILERSLGRFRLASLRALIAANLPQPR